MVVTLTQFCREHRVNYFTAYYRIQKERDKFLAGKKGKYQLFWLEELLAVMSDVITPKGEVTCTNDKCPSSPTCKLYKTATQTDKTRFPFTHSNNKDKCRYYEQKD